MKRCLPLLLALALLLTCPVYAANDTVWEAVYHADTELPGVLALRADGDGLWIGTEDGLYYRNAAGQVQRLFADVLKTQTVNAVAQGEEGSLWVAQSATEDGVLRIDADGAVKDAFTSENSPLPGDRVFAVEPDALGRIWFGSGAGLTCYDPAAGAWTLWPEDSPDAPMISALASDGAGGMWVGHFAEKTAGAVEPYVGDYRHMDALGSVVASYRGHAAQDEDFNAYLPGDSTVQSILSDGVGGVYVIRSGAGADYFDNKVYLGEDGKPIPAQSCVGGRLDRIVAHGTAARYTGRALLPALDSAIENGGTPELRVSAIGRDGRFWLGTSGAGLFVAASVTDVYQQYDSRNTPAFENADFDDITALAVLQNGTVCAGSAGGLRILRPAVLRVSVSDHKVQVDGVAVAPEAYNINGSNYFKLRDLAMCLAGTEKQFSIGWDGEAIVLTTDAAYIPQGGEITPALIDGALLDVIPSTHRLIVDGAAVTPSAYNINGNNYFMLRDLGELLNFYVGWDSELRLVSVITPLSYTA